jgi:hypothetical protein
LVKPQASFSALVASDVLGLVGDDAKTRHFAGRAGGGVDRDQRQLRLGRFVHAFVITDVSAVGGNQRNALDAIVRRSASQRN